jgi:hypothetical protein
MGLDPTGQEYNIFMNKAMKLGFCKIRELQLSKENYVPWVSITRASVCNIMNEFRV